MPYTVKLCYRSIYFLVSNDTELFVQKNLFTGSALPVITALSTFSHIMINFSQLITTTFFYAAAFTNRNRDIYVEMYHPRAGLCFYRTRIRSL
jgi:hypothetical protein